GSDVGHWPRVGHKSERFTFQHESEHESEHKSERGFRMTTEVILTGTGVPHPRPGRAGPGALVRCGEIALQFDAGRATVLRLMEAGVLPHDLTALVLTHVHSDHVVDLPYRVMCGWLHQQMGPTPPLPIVAPEGGPARFVRRM